MIINKADPEALRACILARRNIFRMAECLKENLALLQGSEGNKFLFHSILDTLEASANACRLDHMLSEEHREKPYCILNGEDANFLWFAKSVMGYRSMETDIAIEKLGLFCENFLADYHALTGVRHHAEIILAHLEKEFGYLTKIIGPYGLHTLAFPNITAPGECFDCYVRSTEETGMECTAIIFPCTERDADSPDYFVYEAAVNTLISLLDLEDQLPDETLQHLEDHWDHEIRQARHEDQIAAYYDALHLGLSVGAPYGDVACGEIAKEDRVFWKRHVQELIDAFDCSREEDFLWIRF